MAVKVFGPSFRVTPEATKLLPYIVAGWPFTLADTALFVANPATVIVPLRVIVVSRLRESLLKA